MDAKREQELMDRGNAAIARGDIDAAFEILKELPLTPGTALAAKEALGVEYLLNSGLNLSAAEEAYGKDWLNK